MSTLSDAEAEAIGRRWLAAGGGWRDGMMDGLSRVRTHHATGRSADIRYRDINWEWVEEPVADTSWPDLRDAATRGAAVEVVRERWGGDVWVQGMTCYPPSDGPPLTRHGPVLRWVVGGLHYSDGQRVNGAGPDGFDTEPEALVAALEARHAL